MLVTVDALLHEIILIAVKINREFKDLLDLQRCQNVPQGKAISYHNVLHIDKKCEQQH